MRKHIGRANGTGSVYRLSGNRRKPWIARVTTGWSVDETRKTQQRVTVGYFGTRDEALEALIVFNKSKSHSLETLATFKEVYERMVVAKSESISKSTLQSYETAFRNLSSLHDKVFSRLTIEDLQHVIDTSKKNIASLGRMKILMTLMYDYAIPRNIVDRNLAKYVDLQKWKDKNPKANPAHKFTRDEIRTLWSSNTDMSKCALMLIYSGLRVRELLNLRKENVDLKNQSINITESKTKAGVRVVPIASKTLKFYREFMRRDSEYLIFIDDRDYHGDAKCAAYLAFRIRFTKNLDDLGIKQHRIHDTRHTTRSMLEEKGVSHVISNKIMGHAGMSVAEKYYIHCDIEELLEAIDKI